MFATTANRVELDSAAVTQRIAGALRAQVGQTLRRAGIVVAMSGGGDSSVWAALAALAVGPKRVLGLSLPERESGAESLVVPREWGAQQTQRSGEDTSVIQSPLNLVS